MSGHTPGPWRIGSLESYDGYTGKPYRNVWAGEGEKSTVVCRAIRSEGAETNDVDSDARLIAAAPELLAATKELVTWWENWMPVEAEESGGCEATKTCKAAIAKAEGKT